MNKNTVNATKTKIDVDNFAKIKPVESKGAKILKTDLDTLNLDLLSENVSNLHNIRIRH